MIARIKAKFETSENGNTITFQGYDVIVNDKVLAYFYSEYNAICYVMDDEDLKLV